MKNKFKTMLSALVVITGFAAGFYFYPLEAAIFLIVAAAFFAFSVALAFVPYDQERGTAPHLLYLTLGILALAAYLIVSIISIYGG